MKLISESEREARCKVVDAVLSDLRDRAMTAAASRVSLDFEPFLMTVRGLSAMISQLHNVRFRLKLQETAIQNALATAAEEDDEPPCSHCE